MIIVSLKSLISVILLALIQKVLKRNVILLETDHLAVINEQLVSGVQHIRALDYVIAQQTELLHQVLVAENLEEAQKRIQNYYYCVRLESMIQNTPD